MAARETSTDPALAELRAFGLKYPGAHTKSPWPGHLDLAVNDKTFAYLSVPGDTFSISCKLPHSCDDALGLPFVTPAAYGLGKSGWVRAELEKGPVPVELFKAWIDESYRAQAPKRLAAQLSAAPGVGDPVAVASARPRVAKRPAKKQPARKKQRPAPPKQAKPRASRARSAG